MQVRFSHWCIKWYRKKEELVDADYVIETAVSVPEVLKVYTK